MLGRGGSWVNKPGPSMTSANLFTTNGAFVGQQSLISTYNWPFIWTGTRWWPLGEVDPKYGFTFGDEFFGNDRIGTMDWSANAAQVAGNLLNPGQASVSQSAASGLSRMGLQANAFQLGTMDIFVEAFLQVPTAASSTDDGNIIWGLSDATSFDARGAGTDGAYMVYDRALNGSSIVLYTQSNVATSSILTTANIAAATYYRLGIMVNNNTNAQFFYNGSSVGTIATTLPTGAGRQTAINVAVNKTNGTNPFTVTIDYVRGWSFFRSARG